MIDTSTYPDITEDDLKILPLERSETIPSNWYIDPLFYRLDKEAIFSKTWQGIGHVSRVQNLGDQFIASVADNPLLVVRDNDNILRAFYNVCRHRGGPIALEDGNTKMLQCKYHGWTYRLDGSLRGTPKFDRVELFDRNEYGLIPVNLAQWEGLVFVNLADNSMPLQTLLKGIAERIAPFSLNSKKFYRRINYEVHSNWKVYVDNYLEGYHLPYVHPELCKFLDYQKYITETFEYFSLQHSPIQNRGNLDGSGENFAYYFFIWPNFMLNILPGRLQTNLVIPTAHNRTTVIFDYYYDDNTSEKSLEMIEEDIHSGDKIQQEDAEICEHVQKGLESQAYTKGRFSVECENGVYHFQSLLKQAYRKTLASK